jgi:hypothetical protein
MSSIIDIDTKLEIVTLAPKDIAGSGCCRINLLTALWLYSEIALLNASTPRVFLVAGLEGLW